VKDASLNWTTSNASVASVVNGRITANGPGTAIVTVSLNSNPAVKTDVQVKVLEPNLIDLSRFVNLPPLDDNLIYSQVYFIKDKAIDIPGFSAAMLEAEHNLDFMDWDPASQSLTFTGETGVWDVYYSELYKFFWIRVDKNNNFPEIGTWGRGGGFTQARVWHPTLQGGSGGYNWGREKVRFAAFFKRIGDGVYQTHIHTSPNGIGWMNLVEDLGLWYNHPNNWWTLVAPEGFALNASGSDVTSTAATYGYYRVTVDYNARTRTYEKVD
jgi:hypothetical protein